MDMRGVGGLLKVIFALANRALGAPDATAGHPANTSVVAHGGRVMALFESDAPYELRLTPGGDIQTVGRMDVGGAPAFTAHPKPDAATGAFFLAFSPRSKNAARAPSAAARRPLSHAALHPLSPPARHHQTLHKPTQGGWTTLRTTFRPNPT